MDYKTIANDGIVEEEIKKSRFICHLKRISGEEVHHQIKKEASKANHSCSAIIVGDDGQIKRSVMMANLLERLNCAYAYCSRKTRTY